MYDGICRVGMCVGWRGSFCVGGGGGCRCKGEIAGMWGCVWSGMGECGFIGVWGHGKRLVSCV